MIRSVVLYSILLFISITDGITRRIPDKLLIVLIGFLCAYDFSTGKLRVQSFGAALLLFLLFFVVYRLIGGLGFGDVKLAAVIGYAAGFPDALYGCIIACFLALFFTTGVYLTGNEKQHKSILSERIPFAPFLSAGLFIEQFAIPFILMTKP